MFCVFGTFWNASSLTRRAELSKDEEPPCGRKLGRPPVDNEPEPSSAESAVTIAPVCTEPLAARARGPRDQRKKPNGRLAWSLEMDQTGTPKFPAREQEYHRLGRQRQER